MIPMHILQYVSLFSKTSETFVYDLICRMEDKGIRSTILTHKRVNADQRPFPRCHVAAGSRYSPGRALQKIYNLHRIEKASRCAGVIRALKPDIIHAHFGDSGARMISLLNRLDMAMPLVVSFHGRDVNVLPKYDRLYKKIIVQASQNENVVFVTPSDFLKSKLLALGVNEEKIYRIYNACNPAFCDTSFVRSYASGSRLKVLSVGRYEEVKGYEYLLQASDLLRKKGYAVQVDIIGFGSMEGALRRLIKQKELDGIVSLKGRVSHKAIPDIMKGYDLYVQPSVVTDEGEEENFGVATVEALCNGLPCLVSKIGGLVEVVDDGISGMFFEEKKPEDICEKIIHIMENDFLIAQYSQNAKLIASKKFNAESIGDEWVDVYSGLLS
uniref:Glycosyl transferase group 1 n=1 Tax=Chlorobium phaeobacteroides (strain BS1) TaxID=331678 RepID=B3ELL3_CHLPB